MVRGLSGRLSMHAPVVQGNWFTSIICPRPARPRHSCPSCGTAFVRRTWPRADDIPVERGHHEGGAGGLLRGHRAGAAAAPPRPSGHDGTLPGRDRREGFLPQGRVQGVSRLARACRGAEEGGHGAPSARHATPAPCSGWSTRTPSLRTSGRPACPISITPTSASSISTRSEDEPDVLRDAALGLRDLLDELGLPSWVKTSGSKGFHIAVPLDGTARIGDVARFAHGVGTPARGARSGAPDAGVQQGRSRRPHPGGHRPERLQRDVRGRLRRPREAGSARVRAVHVGGGRARRGRAAAPSRCERWPAGSPRWGTSGRTSAGADDRCAAPSSGSGASARRVRDRAQAGGLADPALQTHNQLTAQLQRDHPSHGPHLAFQLIRARSPATVRIRSPPAERASPGGRRHGVDARCLHVCGSRLAHLVQLRPHGGPSEPRGPQGPRRHVAGHDAVRRQRQAGLHHLQGTAHRSAAVAGVTEPDQGGGVGRGSALLRPQRHRRRPRRSPQSSRTSRPAGGQRAAAPSPSSSPGRASSRRDKTYRRKLKEVILAAYIENLYNKEEILELYLNKVYFGDGLYGVEAAARGYFGRPASRPHRRSGGAARRPDSVAVVATRRQ